MRSCTVYLQVYNGQMTPTSRNWFRSIPSCSNNWLQRFQFSPYPQIMYVLRIPHALISYHFYLPSPTRKEIKMMLNPETSQSLRKPELKCFLQETRTKWIVLHCYSKSNLTAWHCCWKGHLRKPHCAWEKLSTQGKKNPNEQTKKSSFHQNWEIKKKLGGFLYHKSYRQQRNSLSYYLRV